MTKARDLANSADVFDTVTATELGYLDGVTSAIQTQLNSKAPTASPTFTGTPTGGSYVATNGTDQVLVSGGGAIELTATTYGAYLDFKNSTGEDFDVRLQQVSTGGTGLFLNPGAPNGQFVLRNIYTSTSTPTGGSDGDVWIQYA